MLTRLEYFPNELLLEIFAYIDIGHLYRAFWGLNLRLNNLLRSLKNQSLIIVQYNPLLVKLLADQVARLVVETSYNIDLSRFSNLYSLTLNLATHAQIEQIRSESMSKLVRLSLKSPVDVSLTTRLVHDVFSNRFPSLHQAYLGRFDGLFMVSESSSSSCLRSVSINCTDITIVPLILRSSSNLHRLRIEIISDYSSVFHFKPSNHPLKEFSLFDQYNSLSSFRFMQLLDYMCNVERLSLQLWKCSIPFMDLARIIRDLLKNLKQFDCNIIRLPTHEETINFDTLRQFHSCFNRIQYTQHQSGFQTFVTQ